MSTEQFSILMQIYGRLIEGESEPGPEPEPEEPEPEEPEEEQQPKSKRQYDIGKMQALRDAGWSYSKITDEMQCSVQTVSNYLRAE